MTEQFCLKWNNHQSTLISNFDTLLETQRHVDCSLAADGKILRAHKVVLSACSPYLEHLLNQEKDKYPVLIFSDVKYDYLKAMLDYMYRGEVNVLQEHLNGFLKAAETLQIKGLTDQGGGSGETTGGGMKRKPPPPPSLPVPTPISRVADLAPESPANDRSMSPSTSSIPAKRRRQRRGSSDLADSHVDSNSCDNTTLPPVTTKQETDRLSVQPKLEPGLEQGNSSVASAGGGSIQPKTEYIEEPAEEVIEDLTLDDDDDEGSSSAPPAYLPIKAGSSHGSESQGFDPAWQFSGETSNPDMFMSSQDPIGNQTNTQAAFKMARKEWARNFECMACGKRYIWKKSLVRHGKYDCVKLRPMTQETWKQQVTDLLFNQPKTSISPKDSPTKPDQSFPKLCNTQFYWQ